MINTYGLTELEAKAFLECAKSTLYWIQRDLPYDQHELTVAHTFIDEGIAVDALHPITGYVAYDETDGELLAVLDEDMKREDRKYGNGHYLEMR